MKELLKHYKEEIRLETAAMYQRYEEGTAVEELVLGRSAFIDALLARCWHSHFGAQTPGLCLAAAGGYGRRELLPHSDIDLLILCSEEARTAHQEQLEAFVTFLWDTGLNIGQSVRTVDECVTNATADITIVTNLMESRVITGDGSLHKALMPLIGPEKIWPSREFFRSKWEEQLARHKKFNNTEYNLEPNIKACRGGLRDIQMIGWVAKRHFGVGSIEELVANGFLTREEFEIMVNGQSFLLKLRFGMHMLSKREEDRLLFELQTKLTPFFGYADTAANLAVEKMMKQYYRWAQQLSELNDMIMQLFDETILRACEPEVVMELNPRFRLRNQCLEVTNDRVFKQYPYALLEIFLLIARHDAIRQTRASTIRLVRESRHLINNEFRNDPRNRQIFVDILRSPRRVASTLQEMKRHGILGTYIPAFGEIIGQTQHDLFHIYTVDAHTLLVLKNLRRFTYEDMREKFPIASQVMKRIEKKDLLYLACLFHDIAKGRGGDHSALGAEDAIQFCRDHGYSTRDGNLVAWLVKSHLRMSHTSQKKDINDPDVIRDFALAVGDIKHLDYLFVLTVADINGTNHDLWNSWRASLLHHLYSETKRALRRGLEKVIDLKESIDDTCQQAVARLRETGVDMALAELVLSNAGNDYFLRETPNDIAWQTEAIVRQMDSDQPLILIRQAPNLIFSGATQIFVHTRDKIHTFALVAAAMEHLYLNIVDARIYSSNSGYTLDTFFVLDANGQPLELTDARIEQMRQVIADYLSAKSHENLQQLVKRRTPRQLRFFTIPTSTSITHDHSEGTHHPRGHHRRPARPAGAHRCDFRRLRHRADQRQDPYPRRAGGRRIFHHRCPP
jgi:[protein-PII] uridylyltransferase